MHFDTDEGALEEAALLESRILYPKRKQQCLQFFYRMTGSPSDRLVIWVRRDDGTGNVRKLAKVQTFQGTQRCTSTRGCSDLEPGPGSSASLSLLYPFLLSSPLLLHSAFTFHPLPGCLANFNPSRHVRTPQPLYLNPGFTSALHKARPGRDSMEAPTREMGKEGGCIIDAPGDMEVKN